MHRLTADSKAIRIPAMVPTRRRNGTGRPAERSAPFIATELTAIQKKKKRIRPTLVCNDEPPSDSPPKSGSIERKSRMMDERIDGSAHPSAYAPPSASRETGIYRFWNRIRRWMAVVDHGKVIRSGVVIIHLPGGLRRPKWRPIQKHCCRCCHYDHAVTNNRISQHPFLL